MFRFVSKFDKLELAKCNYKCGEYPRALLYLEMYINENPDQVSRNLQFLAEVMSISSALFIDLLIVRSVDLCANGRTRRSSRCWTITAKRTVPRTETFIFRSVRKAQRRSRSLWAFATSTAVTSHTGWMCYMLLLNSVKKSYI